MISKDTFVKTMNKLEQLDQRMNDVDNAMRVLSPDFGGFYIPEVISMQIDLMSEIFEDRDDWLGYFVYECDFLRDYNPGKAFYEDGSSINITSWADVYDFLIKNMEE